MLNTLKNPTWSDAIINAIAFVFLTYCFFVHVLETLVNGEWLLGIAGIVIFPLGMLHGFLITVGIL